MKIFGTIYPFIEVEERSLKLGRHVANYEFIRSLIANSTFDEFHLFCLNTHHFSLTQRKLQEETLSLQQKAKVRLFLFNHLTTQLQSASYYVFHLGGWGYFFPGLIYLRNKYARNMFPVTASIHSLNGIETNYHALKVLHAPHLPYDTIICSSMAGEQVLKKIFNRLMNHENSAFFHDSKVNTTVIPLAISETMLEPLDKNACRKRLCIPENATMILTVGRLSPQTKSDLYPLIITMKRLIEEHCDRTLFLCIAGAASTPQKALIDQMIRECGIETNTRLFVNFDTAHKKMLYYAADIFVSLSDNVQETFGISVIEAMGAGIPVVVSDIDGYRESVSHGITGYNIATMWLPHHELGELADIMNFETMQLILAQCMAVNTEELFHSLHELILDKEKRMTMGINAREHVRKNYQWSKIIQQYEKTWHYLHQSSLAYKEKAVVRTNPFCMDYFTVFSHYPTSVIDETMQCSITSTGMQILQNNTLPVPYSDIGVLLNTATIMQILRYVAATSGTVKEIAAAAAIDSDRTAFYYTLLWMAKYAMITIHRTTEQ